MTWRMVLPSDLELNHQQWATGVSVGHGVELTSSGMWLPAESQKSSPGASRSTAGPWEPFLTKVGNVRIRLRRLNNSKAAPSAGLSGNWFNLDYYCPAGLDRGLVAIWSVPSSLRSRFVSAVSPLVIAFSAISIIFPAVELAVQKSAVKVTCQCGVQHRQPSVVVFPLKGGGALTRASWEFRLLARALGWWPRLHSHPRPRTCRVTCDNFFKIVSHDSTETREDIMKMEQHIMIR